ncbi:DUF2784 domain-containing protein, partial [Phenylobacterium sp.]|uniref:DUF2784 domain-containing protein n=1 Tax=Phenylobacterium sp. TaxID=1871053 RepID=UPI0028115C48
MTAVLGQLVLAIHLLVIAFNVLGLVAIPLGAWRGWPWVRVRWWRLLHLVSWIVVAAQAVLGRACFLTVWQDDLTGGGTEDPMIMRWVNGLIYWDLPMWVFAGLYLALFAAVLAF